MDALEAWYSHDGPTTVTTADELDAVLDLVVGWGAPHIVELVNMSDPLAGPVLNVGMDSTRGVGVVYYTAERRGYYSTNGGKPVADGETPLYYYQTADTEYPADAEVSLVDVRRAAHEFLTTRTRPTAVEWRDIDE